GDGGASHRWTGKLSLHEESVAVPFILSVPGQSKVVDSDHLVSGLDIFPTVCGLAGVEPPTGLEGQDLSPLLSGKVVPPRESLVTALYDARWADKQVPPLGEGRMLRTERYKYVAYAWGRNAEALFDMQEDPGETRNLAGEPAFGDLVKRHRDKLKA